LLADEFRCIRWDARGFGETISDGKPFDFWQQARDGAALLAHLGIEQAIWLGLSQGGFIALRAAIQHPEAVGGLVLVDTMAGADNGRSRESKRAFFGRWVADGLSAPVLTGFLRTTLGDGVEPPPGLVESMHAVDQGALAQSLECLLDRDSVEDQLSQVLVPSLVIHGECDSSIPLERAEQMCHLLDSAEDVVVIPSAGHSACVTHPELVSEHVARFVRATFATSSWTNLGAS
jgi:pimeloyl-ACP methyl ester carboxylesterase